MSRKPQRDRELVRNMFDLLKLLAVDPAKSTVAYATMGAFRTEVHVHTKKDGHASTCMVIPLDQTIFEEALRNQLMADTGEKPPPHARYVITSKGREELSMFFAVEDQWRTTHPWPPD